MQNYVGKHIDRYRVTERLGMGGMAVVYKAYDTRLERDVAIKIIRSEAIPPEQYFRLMKRFEREAKSQARFDHKHIVHVYDYGEVNGSPFLVLAYIPGGTLKLRTGQPISYQQAIRWLMPVADALSYAHKRGVIHRDIKPSNILFDSEDQPILTDFGIAKLLETKDATLTGTGLGVGTPEYMAPEQWQGQTTPATDQYALGVVLYELLTGQKPYTADTPAAVAIQQATEPLRSPRALAPGIPVGVEKLLLKALARDPQDRYADMLAFWNELEKQLTTGAENADKTEEVIYTEPIPIAAEPKPLPMSEAETVDELTPTPVESLSEKMPAPTHPTRHAVTDKTKLPSRLLWAGGAVLAVVLLVGGMAILASGRARMPVSGAEPTEKAVAQVDAPLPTTMDTPKPTATETTLPSPSATVTHVPTSTFTPLPEGTFLMPNFVNENFKLVYDYTNKHDIEVKIKVVEDHDAGIVLEQIPPEGTLITHETIIEIQVSATSIKFLQMRNTEDNPDRWLTYFLNVSVGDIIFVVAYANSNYSGRGGGYGYILDNQFNKDMLYEFHYDDIVDFKYTCFLPDVQRGQYPIVCNGYFSLYKLN